MKHFEASEPSLYLGEIDSQLHKQTKVKKQKANSSHMTYSNKAKYLFLKFFFF